ncbi:hypothetical protein FB451DRAFT_1411385 [Mycena latifolia]|nr:hypothetical protein FB451DRAFT_1411385 [Mycena latifolia]
MAVAKSSPRTIRFTRPKVLRPMRAVRLARSSYDALDRFVAAANVDLDSKCSLYDPVSDDLVMCEFFVAAIHGMVTSVYLLSVAAYDPRAGETPTIRLATYRGSPGDVDAPLWIRRLPPHKLLAFSQPRAFVASLVGGMTDIPVKPNYQEFWTPSAEMLSWARVAAIGTPVRRPLARRCQNAALANIRPAKVAHSTAETLSTVCLAVPNSFRCLKLATRAFI